MMRNPFAPKGLRSDADPRVAYQVASLCLQYPDNELLGRADLLREAVADLPSSTVSAALGRFVTHLATADPAALREHYIEVFDLSRRHTLYLTYWTHGDTRRRGEALADIKGRYRAAGYIVDTGGELPDFLPMVLEFAARVDPASGRELLVDNRACLELIRLALEEKESPYADLLAAVCATLPGDPPPDKASALAMRGETAAVEQVGLESGDPRLMPLFPKAEMTVLMGGPQ